MRFAGIILASIIGLQTPSVAGQWKLDPTAPQCQGFGPGCSDGGGAKVLCGDNLSIEITATAITLQRVVNDETLKLSFPLDGTAVRHPIPSCRNRNLPTDPAMTAALQREMDALKAVVEPGSDDMTTKATRDGSDIVLRSTSATPTEKGVQPWLVTEQTQRLKLVPSGHLVVDTERTSTEKTGRVIPSRSRLVYSKGKG